MSNNDIQTQRITDLAPYLTKAEANARYLRLDNEIFGHQIVDKSITRRKLDETIVLDIDMLKSQVAAISDSINRIENELIV